MDSQPSKPVKWPRPSLTKGATEMLGVCIEKDDGGSCRRQDDVGAEGITRSSGGKVRTKVLALYLPQGRCGAN